MNIECVSEYYFGGENTAWLLMQGSCVIARHPIPANGTKRMQKTSTIPASSSFGSYRYQSIPCLIETRFRVGANLFVRESLLC